MMEEKQFRMFFLFYLNKEQNLVCF